ncbi:nuclear transport factor 2 family protein [Xanthomonas translucens]|uniref:nuclear transport factor 2 family protein n=1 Tax=Xanthomonas campestris pv. translucens TaxID=343 RepID=UPI001F3883C2|nr:nuclear transport factor 2 family protein [Xanthomonas translucens]UJB15979.1 nuclear transport factor 2 family protein [Xanthomonas translucens pv. undulosa]
MSEIEARSNEAHGDARRIFEQWHRSVVERDLHALMALYADDAMLETPLAYVVSAERQDGRLQRREAIKAFFAASFAQPENGLGRWYRTDRCHASHRQVVWEYPRETPEGDQVDLVEVMDIDARGLIACHRVYWSWKGVQTLLTVLGRKP